MTHKTDILVIGGGVIGVCSAYFLAGKGKEVTIVDKGEICSGASYGNLGLIVPSHTVPLANPAALSQGLRWLQNPDSPFYIKPRLDPDLLSWLWKFYRASKNPRQVQDGTKILNELARRSLQLYRDLSSVDGLEFGFGQKGLLMVCRDAEHLKKLSDESREMEQNDAEAQILNPGEMQDLIPEVRLDAAGGVFYPHDAHLTPHRFVRGIAKHIERNGVRIHNATEVVGFEVSGTRITKVRTSNGDYEPEEVVLAGGAWTPSIMRDLQLKLPVQPAKGYSISIKRPEKFSPIPLYFSEAKVIVTPMGENLRFGGTLEFAGLDLSVNKRRVRAIIKAVGQYMPEPRFLGELESSEVWCGLRPCTPDGLPFIGRSKKFENLTVAAGHGMIGMSLGPVTGELVAQLLAGEPVPYDMNLLGVDRFG
ncbi:FAD-dependent oxidoreductase [candidate division KSB1 bacterium]|nr:FAD-dependent oxidoreductase [candidate division KSB1 bacterium]